MVTYRSPKPYDLGSNPNGPAIFDNLNTIILSWYKNKKQRSLWQKFTQGDITLHRGFNSPILKDRKALCLSVIGIHPTYRKQGYFNKVIEILENTAEKYVIIENVVNPILLEKLIERKYTKYTDKYGKINFIKNVKEG